jgi:hypothetical protein
MGKVRAIMAVMAACVLLGALALAPLFWALTHGPGQLAIEADHAAWHADHRAHGHATDHDHHDHHDATDHDHTPTVILPSVTDLDPPPARKTWTAQANPRDSTIRDGPRRPPRLS